MDVNCWGLSDADACKNGIYTMFWKLHGRRGETRREFRARWQGMWENIFPITRFGADNLCDFNPVNRDTKELEMYARALDVDHTTPGTVNVDYLYLDVV